MRNQHSRPKLPPQHRAKRAKGPGTRPWSGPRGETPCGYRAKPCRSLRQSLIRRKPTRCRLQYQKHIEVRYQIKVISRKQNLHRLSSPKRNVDTQRAERFCGKINYPEYMQGRPCVTRVQNLHNFSIVGERRNFCFAEIRRPDPLARLCTSA